MSQNYTPVEWVDETTSQQGTLINKARLDQMQTAHHYADGFEEVDTIPTADPGVSYHKVVYCTADTTFYRWDGTAWTKDVDDDTKALLNQEIARATAAEGELAQDIEDEATARAQADTALGERITAEAGAREGADTALGARIDAEAEYRETVDRQIYADIGRLNGQTLPLNPGSSTPTIQQSIVVNADNITNLTNAMDNLTYDLGQEVSNRENADTQLAADITAEVQARAAAIASLQASKADTTALTDGSVTKIGTADIGSDLRPIKLVGGVPTAVTNDLADVAEVQAALDKKVDISLGVVPWSATVTYPANAFTNYNGTLYRSLQAGNVGHVPLSETAWWSEYSPAAGSSGLIGPDNTYTANIGDGSSTVIAVTHGLGTKEVLWAVWSNTDGHVVGASADKTSTSVLTLTFAAAPAAGEYRVLVFRPGDAARIYEQTFAASSTVVITHNLGRLPSGISVYDPTGRKVGVRMTVDTTTATLSFAGYEAGNYKIEVIA